MSKRFFIFIFTLVGLISFSQTKENQNFKNLDSSAKMIKYEDNLPELVNRLTENCKTEEKKIEPFSFGSLTILVTIIKHITNTENQLR